MEYIPGNIVEVETASFTLSHYFIRGEKKRRGKYFADVFFLRRCVKATRTKAGLEKYIAACLVACATQVCQLEEYSN